MAAPTVIDEDKRLAVINELQEALLTVDRIVMDQRAEVTYETLQRSGFRRPDGWNRKYSLADARRHAQYAARRLRAAWEILDPSSIR